MCNIDKWDHMESIFVCDKDSWKSILENTVACRAHLLVACIVTYTTMLAAVLFLGYCRVQAMYMYDTCWHPSEMVGRVDPSLEKPVGCVFVGNPWAAAVPCPPWVLTIFS